MERTGKKEARFPIFQKRLRELQGDLSNTAFADFLGMSRQTVGFYLNGDRVPDILGLTQIARKYDVSSDWLLGLSSIRTPDEDIRKICSLLPLSESAIQKLLEMAAPDNLGGDPEILYALNILLEGLVLESIDGKLDTNGYALLDIANYLRFRPLQNSDIPECLLRKSNFSDDKFLDMINSALETNLLQEISNSLRYLRSRYYIVDDCIHET